MSLLTQYHDYQNKELARAEIVCTGVSVCISFFVHRCALPFFDFLTKDDSYSKKFPLLFYCPFPGEFDYNYLELIGKTNYLLFLEKEERNCKLLIPQICARLCETLIITPALN